MGEGIGDSYGEEMKKYHRYLSQVAGFGRWLREIGNRRKVSLAARGALYEIYWQMNESGWPDVLEIGAEELADLVGTTRKTFGALMAELEKAGLVEQVAGRGRKPNGYRVRAFEPLAVAKVAEPEPEKSLGLAVVRAVWMALGENWNDYNEGILARVMRKTSAAALIIEMTELFKAGRLRASELESRSMWSPKHFGEARSEREEPSGKRAGANRSVKRPGGTDFNAAIGGGSIGEAEEFIE